MLGILPGASADEAKLAYFRLARQCHPDATAGLGEESLESTVGEQTPTMRFTEVKETDLAPLA